MNPAERSAGQGFSHGMYDPAAGGFGYESLHILHGSHYSAYYSDALLLAAWTEGQLAPIASKPQWYREKKDMVMRQVAITCVTDGSTIDVPDDADTSVRAAVARVRATYRTGDDGRVLVRQHEAASGRLIDLEDRVHLCIRLVRELASWIGSSTSRRRRQWPMRWLDRRERDPAGLCHPLRREP